MNAEQRRKLLGVEIRRRAPEEPGVYFFHGEAGEILYVGKAVNLRRRLLSHLRPSPSEEEVRHSILVHAARTFGCEVVPSELQALVREDELIKLHRPPFNVRQNDYLEYRYLERTDERFPRFCLVDHESDFGDRSVFGPYRDRHAAERLRLLLQRVFGVRSCAIPIPTDRCLEFDLGHCLGPCRAGTGVEAGAGKAAGEGLAADSGLAADAYASGIASAEAFLRGEVAEAEGRIRRSMKAAAARQEFERAQEAKEQLLFCRRFGKRARFLTEFRERRLTVVEGGRTHLFLRGRRVDSVARLGPGSTGSADCGTGTPDGLRPDRRFVHDRANVVHGWLRRNRDRCRYWFEEA